MFFGEVYVNQNIMYFKTFNFLLMRNGYNNINEIEIGDLIQNNCYKIVQRLSDIINNSPFDNINIVINKKTREVDIDKLITISNIVYINIIFIIIYLLI